MAERVRHFDVLVIGAGPAGLAAARAAASHGVQVGVVDAQPRAGGQVWRSDVQHGAPADARTLLAQVAGDAAITLLTGLQIVLAQPGWLLADGAQGSVQLHYAALVLATGARELMLPFPGWTLPGVTGAGAAQALTKQGWPVRGKRVLVAGSGPLLLASAATLQRHGAQVLGIHEQASAAVLRGFALQLWRWPGKAAQAVALRLQLHAVAYRSGSVVVAAHGDTQLREVEIDALPGAAAWPAISSQWGTGWCRMSNWRSCWAASWSRAVRTSRYRWMRYCAPAWRRCLPLAKPAGSAGVSAR